MITSYEHYHHELVIDSLPKCITYDGKLPIRLNVSDIKMPEIGIGFHYTTKQQCEITILDYRNEWIDAIKKWYRYIFDTYSTKYYAISNHKIDGKVYEYDEDGNVTVTFNVYGIFPLSFNEDYYKDNVTIIFSTDSVGALEKVQGYKKENLFVKNVPTISDAIKNDYLSWDEYFMSIAVLTSLRSKDENTKVGSVIVSNDNKVLGTGYNWLPTSINESLFPTTNDIKNNSYENTKYAYVVHSELNAILNTTVLDLTGSRLYCTLFPCNECAKIISQKRISEVIYLSDKYHDESSYIASRKMFDAMNITTRKYEGNLKLINKQ